MMTCWFCEERAATRGSGVRITLKGERIGTRKTGFKEWTTYYEQKVVTVPRCKVCESKHQQAGKYKQWPLLFFVLPILTVSASAIGISDSAPYWETAVFVSGAIGVIAAIGLWVYFAVVRPAQIRSGTKPKGTWARYPEVQELREQGWRYWRV